MAPEPTKTRVPLNDFENLAVGAFGGIVETCVQSASRRDEKQDGTGLVSRLFGMRLGDDASRVDGNANVRTTVTDDGVFLCVGAF